MSCRSSQVKNEYQSNDILFPTVPPVIDEKTGEPILMWFPEIWYKTLEDNEFITVPMQDVVVMPTWFWFRFYDYVLDTEYAIDCLNLKRTGDP